MASGVVRLFLEHGVGSRPRTKRLANYTVEKAPGSWWLIASHTSFVRDFYQCQEATPGKCFLLMDPSILPDRVIVLS
jgi:hypothetical protein